MTRAPMTYATLHTFDSVDGMIQSLPKSNKLERGKDEGDNIIQRVRQISGKGNTTQVFIRLPGITAQGKPNTSLYCVRVKVPFAEVAAELGKRGAIFYPARTNEHGYQSAPRYNYDVV